jgi:hypothetical protein
MWQSWAADEEDLKGEQQLSRLFAKLKNAVE